MDGRIRQNLIDAGCSQGFLERFNDAQTDSERLHQLQERRKELLGSIHAEQHKLDCLDYLIFQMSDK